MTSKRTIALCAVVAASALVSAAPAAAEPTECVNPDGTACAVIGSGGASGGIPGGPQGEAGPGGASGSIPGGPTGSAGPGGVSGCIPGVGCLDIPG